MRNVLHIVSYFPPDRIGGVGEVVATVHRALLAAGAQSTVVTTGRSREDPSVLRVASTPAGFVFGVLRAIRLAARADVVHIHHGEGLALLLLMRLLQLSTPVLLTMHVSVPEIRRASRRYVVDGRVFDVEGVRAWLEAELVLSLRAWLDTAALALADQVTFISRSAAADILPPAEASRARVIYNGLPETAPPSGVEPTAIVPTDLLFVGTDSLRKRVGLLPLVLRRVRELRPSATLRLVGFDPAENAALLELAERLGVREAMIFEGRRRSEELSPYYAAAGVLLVPSVYEGLPMVILEAFRSGLPCVATRVSGHPEVIADGENGLLVSRDNPAQMANAALRILGDPTLRARMSAAAIRCVRERFSVERQVAEYLEEYRALASAAR